MALLRPEEEAKAREWFAALERPVELYVALGAEETPLAGAQDVDFGAEAVRVAEGLAELGESVSCVVLHAPDLRPGVGGSADDAASHREQEPEPEGFPRFPAISVRPEGRDVGIRYDGLPWGYELGSLVGAIVEAGKAEPTLRPESVEALAGLDSELALDVFVTPT